MSLIDVTYQFVRFNVIGNSVNKRGQIETMLKSRSHVQYCIKNVGRLGFKFKTREVGPPHFRLILANTLLEQHKQNGVC